MIKHIPNDVILYKKVFVSQFHQVHVYMYVTYVSSKG